MLGSLVGHISLTQTRKPDHEPWYHGIRPWADLRADFKNDGDFLVRLSEYPKSKLDFILCSMNNGKVDCFRIVTVLGTDKFALRLEADKDRAKCRKFKRIRELVEYYTRHRLPSGHRLVHGIQRPTYLLHNGQIKFKEKDKLGEGNFCAVYSGTITRDEKDGNKVCRGGANAATGKHLRTYETRRSMIDEAKLIVGYLHPHIVQMHGVAADSPPLLIAFEKCPGGSLLSFLLLLGSPSRLSDSERVQYALEMAHGMRYLHGKKCIHRDLAARNVLIAMTGRMKICDFGLSKVLRPDAEVVEDALKEAPIVWMAPETLHKKSKFSYASDVWSFGVVLYELWTSGDKPYSQLGDDGAVFRLIRKGIMPQFPLDAPHAVGVLMKEIWAFNRRDRPTFADVISKMIEIRRDLPQLEDADYQVNTLPGVVRESKEPPACEFAPPSSVGTTTTETIGSTENIDESSTGGKTPPNERSTITISMAAPIKDSGAKNVRKSKTNKKRSRTRTKETKGEKSSPIKIVMDSAARSPKRLRSTRTSPKRTTNTTTTSARTPVESSKTSSLYEPIVLPPSGSGEKVPPPSSSDPVSDNSVIAKHPPKSKGRQSTSSLYESIVLPPSGSGDKVPPPSSSDPSVTAKPPPKTKGGRLQPASKSPN